MMKFTLILLLIFICLFSCVQHHKERIEYVTYDDIPIEDTTTISASMNKYKKVFYYDDKIKKVEHYYKLETWFMYGIEYYLSGGESFNKARKKLPDSIFGRSVIIIKEEEKYNFTYTKKWIDSNQELLIRDAKNRTIAYKYVEMYEDKNGNKFEPNIRELTKLLYAQNDTIILLKAIYRKSIYERDSDLEYYIYSPEFKYSPYRDEIQQILIESSYDFDYIKRKYFPNQNIDYYKDTIFLPRKKL